MRRWLDAVLVALYLPLAFACEPREEIPEESAVPPAERTYTEETAEGPGSPPSQRVTVVNPLPYEMVITATYGDRSEILGAIDSETSAGFFVQAEPGTEVLLQARAPGEEFQLERRWTVDHDSLVWELVPPQEGAP